MGKGSWEVRVYRRFLRLLTRRWLRSYEADMVRLFQDRLVEIGPATGRRLGFLLRTLLDGIRHGMALCVQPDKGRSGSPKRRSGAGPGGVGSVTQDVRFGLRTLRKRPLFATIAVVTLGLGIGGTTAIFSVVDGVLIRDLPYRDPEGLVSIWKAWPEWREIEGLEYVWDHIHFPWIDYMSLRDGATTLSGVAAFYNDERVLIGEGRPEELSVGMASANLFQVLGVQPTLGRTFLEEEVPPGAVESALVALLSHELWVRRFGADPGVLGHSVQLDEASYQVVGVLPSGFRLGSDLISTHDNGGGVDPGLRDVWIPLPPVAAATECGNCFEVLGRLAPGSTIPRVRDEVQALMTMGPESQLARVVGRKEMVTRGFTNPLLVLLGGAGCLLLIACVNVAGLLIGEAAGRRHEVAVRSALGAGRRRVVRQLLTENVLLGLIGSGVGILVAWLGTDALLALAPPIPRLEEVHLSGRVLALAVAAGVGTGVLFGLAPSLTLAGRAMGCGLGRRGQTSDRGARSLQSGVVTVQVGLTVVLLVAGGLFFQSFMKLMEVNPGFDPEGLAAVEISMPPDAPRAPGDSERFFREIVGVLEAVPGVSMVGGIQALPFPGGVNSQTIQVRRDGQPVWVAGWARFVLPSYHETMGIPLVAGRLLSDADAGDAPRAMLVSESLAELNWPGESPVGVRVGYNGEAWTIVGVVGDVSQKSLAANVEGTFYVSTAQYPRRRLALVARTPDDPARYLPALQEAVWSVDPDIPISAATTVENLMSAAESDDRFRAVLLSVFAALATLLAAVGIFGVTARGVAQRGREMGIRTALGARSSELVSLVLRGSMVSAVMGTGLGLLAAYWISSLISHLLFGIGGHDPLTFAGVGTLLLSVCLLASYVPAHRVTRIQPMEVIAEE
jgi:putative ABC transport system permease protein